MKINIPGVSFNRQSPLAQWSDFTFRGAFKVPDGNPLSGSSPAGRLQYSHGAIGMSNTAGNIFVQGNLTAGVNDDFAIGEVTIPALNPADTFANLPTATFVQGFLDINANVPTGNPQDNDRPHSFIMHGGKLIGTACKFYDADTPNTHALWRVDDPSNLDTSTVGGFYTISDPKLYSAYEACGWLSPVPAALQAELGFNHVIGNANSWSISSRGSDGPTCFGINLDDVTATTPVEPISTPTFLNYSQTLGAGRLHDAVFPAHGYNQTDFAYNCVRVANPYRVGSDVDYPDQGLTLGNDVWTVGAIAAFGFFIPNTRTYAVFGVAPGTTHGMGYKIVRDADFLSQNELTATFVNSTSCTVPGDVTVNYPDNKRIRFIESGVKSYGYVNGASTFSGGLTTITIKDGTFTANLDSINQGNPTGGGAPYIAGDWSYYHWFYNVDDLKDAKAGTINVYDVVPYSYGPIDIPFSDNDPDVISQLRGGAFDEVNNRLYLSVRQGDTNGRPYVLAFDV